MKDWWSDNWSGLVIVGLFLSCVGMAISLTGIFWSAVVVPEEKPREVIPAYILDLEAETVQHGGETWLVHTRARNVGGTDYVVVVQSLKDGRVIAVPEGLYEQSWQRK